MSISLVPLVSHASESGVSTYHNGLVDLLAGYMAPPGTLTWKDYFVYWNPSARVVTPNGVAESHNRVSLYADIIQVAYATRFRILGGQYGFSLLIPFAMASESARVNLVHMAPFSRRTSTVGGWGDLIATPAALHWQFGRFHVLGAFSIYAPTGSYDKNRMLNIGRNIWAFEPDVGVTWLNEETGREASAFVGYTVNLENTATHYASGNEFHADFALAQHLPHGFLLGAAGYAFQQTTADRGRGSVLGPFMGRVFALGPIAGYSLRIGHKAVNFTAKYQFEFADQNRLTGDVLWLTAMLAF